MTSCLINPQGAGSFFMTIPNFLTILRLLINPFFLLIYIYPSYFFVTPLTLPFVLLGLFFLSELSDLFDGYFARKFGQVTELGKILDPMADSITRICAFLTFTQAPVNLPVLFVFIILYRDSVVSTLRTICALKGFTLAARISGKAKAVIQACAIFIVLVAMSAASLEVITQDQLQYIAILSVGFAALYTIYSGVEYIFVNRNYITNMLEIV